jgi:sugar/nucleoside kinase (ribokinase family)
MAGIACAGHWVLDHINIIDHFPEHSGICTILHSTITNGGAPFNVMVDLANLAVPFPTLGIGCIGDDNVGQQILSICHKKQLDIEYLQCLTNQSTSYTDVMVEQKTGERTMFHFHGANDQFSLTHVPISILKQKKTKLFYLGHLLLMAALEKKDPEYERTAAHLLHDAQAAGMETVVDIANEKDPERFQTMILPCLPYVDHLIIDELAAEKLSHTSINSGRGIDTSALISATKILLGKGVRKNVILHMPEGALWTSADLKSLWYPSFNIDQIISVCGAGDAFCSGIMVGLHESWPIEKTLRLAHAAAGLTLRKADNSEGILPIEKSLAAVNDWTLRGKICASR